MKQKLQNYYDSKGYDVKVIEEIQFNEFSILRCQEWHPVGMPWTYFDIIAKDGKFYNRNFDDIILLNEECGL